MGGPGPSAVALGGAWLSSFEARWCPAWGPARPLTPESARGPSRRRRGKAAACQAHAARASAAPRW